MKRFLCGIVILIAIGSVASAVTLTASPSEVGVPIGELGSVDLSWGAAGTPNISFYVSYNSGPEQLMYIESGWVGHTYNVPWIQRGGLYDFNLYAGPNKTYPLLDTIQIEGYPILSAEPSLVVVPIGGLGSVTLSSRVAGTSQISLYMSENSGPEQLMHVESGMVGYSLNILWIQQGYTYDFNYYGGPNKTYPLLDTIRVEGSPLEGYSLLDVDRYCMVPPGESVVSCAASGLDTVQLCVITDGGPEFLLWEDSGLIPRIDVFSDLEEGHDYVLRLYAGTYKSLLIDEALVSTRLAQGVGLAVSGENAGKLISYDESGSEVPLKAFGVNYYDAFYRYLLDSTDTSFVQGFSYLEDHGIPVARVMANGYWPSDWNLYFTNKAEYYRRLDYFVEQAELHGVGLILSCFWSASTVGELVDNAVAAGYLIPGTDFTPPNPLNTDVYGNLTYAEYKRALGRDDSGSVALIADYTSELVERYKDSPAIWGWEFGNEYNLYVDHPNMPAMRARGGTTSLGMMLPATTTNTSQLPAFTGPDDLLRADVKVAKLAFTLAVRPIDPWRFILSGDALPRPSAYHNWTEHTWTTDSRSQLAQVLPVDNPEMDTVTIHVYPDAPGVNDKIFFTNNPLSIEWVPGQYKELLDYFVAEGAALGQPLVVGEWGVEGDGTTEAEKEIFHRMMQALIDSDVQLSMLWDFDNKHTGQAASWWVNPGTPKEYQLTNEDPNLWDLEQVNSLFTPAP